MQTSPVPSPPSCPPSYRLAQPHSTDLGEELSRFAALMGYDLLPWQGEVLRDWSAVGPDGKWLHKRNGLAVPRQNGKSIDGIVWAAFLVVAMGAVVLWTEHNYSTTVEMLRRFQDVFGTRPGDTARGKRHFNRRLSRVNSKTAQEAFFFDNGGSLHFSTRTASAALGYAFDAVFYDEAQLLADEHVQTISPTTTSGRLKNFQEVYLGTPPRAGCHADVFRRVHDEAHEGASADLSWNEWGVTEVGDVRDESRWYAVNPSLGTVADAAPLRAHAGSMLPLAFAQEHLGYWLPTVAGGVIARDAWERCRIDKKAAPVEGRVSYGVKFSPDGSRVALAACLRPDEGPAHVELVEYRECAEGTAWLADWLERRRSVACCAVVDGRSGADALVERLAGRMPRKAVVVPRSREVVAAAAGLDVAVREGALTHIGQAQLDDSALGSVRRKVGSEGGWGFGGEDSAPVEAVALALWGAKNSKRDPRRRQEASF